MSETVRQGELVGKGLMAYETTEEVGSAEHFWVDVKRSQAVALAYKSSSLIARKQSVSWENIVKLSGDRILIHTSLAADEADLSAAQNMTGLEVWTDGGDHIGTLIDLSIDSQTGQVQRYLFALDHEQREAEAAEAAAIKVYEIAPPMIISAGKKRLMIAEEDAQRAQMTGEMIARSLVSKAADKLVALPSDLPADFGSLFERGKSFAEKAAQQAKERARQFTNEQLAHQDLVDADSLPDITAQLQSKTEQAKQQIQQQLGKAAEQAEKTKAQMDGRLNQSSWGRSLSHSFNQAIDKLKRPADADIDPIDVEAFEVWEDD